MRFPAGSVAVLLLLCCISDVSIAYRFVEVRFPGAADTIATGVTDGGLVVGTYGPSVDVRRGTEIGRRGFLHNPVTGTYQTISAFNSIATNVASINNSGLVVGDYFVGNRLRGYVYNPVSNSYTDVFPASLGAVEAVVGDIDDSGVMIGTFSKNTSLSAPDGNSLEVRGFRATPLAVGGYSYEAIDFPFATSTFASSRNLGGLEVGTAIEQSVFGDSVFAYSLLSNQEYTYPDPLANSTQFNAISNSNRILGVTTIVTIDGIQVSAKNVSFLLQADAQGTIDASSLQVLSLPCPSCSFSIDLFSGVPGPTGRSVATNLSDTGTIVGFSDFGTPNVVGYLGLSVPGDFNLDGVANAADYTVWRDTLGSTTLLIADQSANSIIDSPDYAAWAQAYGGGGGAIGVTLSAAVPEPQALVLAVAMVLPAARRPPPMARWRRRPPLRLVSGSASSASENRLSPQAGADPQQAVAKPSVPLLLLPGLVGEGVRLSAGLIARVL
jgi:hypothetical protein